MKVKCTVRKYGLSYKFKTVKYNEPARSRFQANGPHLVNKRPNPLVTMSICSCCNKTVEDNRTIKCTVCDKLYNIECVGVSATDGRKFRTNPCYNYNCNSCAELGNTLGSLMKAIAALQDEIKLLKNSLRDSPPQTSNVSALDMERIIQEIADREKRKCNIIIFGYKETAGESSEQNQLDQKMVQDVFSTLGIDGGDMKLLRLGKFDPTKEDSCRPVRVTLPSESVVLDTLRSSSTLKLSPSFTKLFVARDKTPMQLKIHNDARLELNRRLDSGETDLKIRYSNGIPTIVSSLN